MEYVFSKEEYDEYNTLKKERNKYYDNAMKLHSYLKEKFPDIINTTTRYNCFNRRERELLDIRNQASSIERSDLNRDFTIQVDYYNLTQEIGKILQMLEIEHLARGRW